MVFTTDAVHQTSFTDAPLRENWPYRYQVFVTTADGAAAGSNVVETLPFPTATPTPSMTPTSTRTPTPCAQHSAVREVLFLGAPGRQSFDIRIDHVVVLSRPQRVTVGGILCWANSNCALASVGPGGVRVEEGCLSTPDCDDDPFPGRKHAAFYFQRNNGPPVFATAPLGQSETLNLATLVKGDIIKIGVNDGDVSNNRDGFHVTVEYTYLDPSCPTAASL
jgi:hypothetical protein